MIDTKILALAGVAALIPVFAAAPAAADTARADLAAFGEVPALAAPGTGEFKAKIRAQEGLIEYELSYEGLASPIRQAHIHFGNIWESGGISAFLCTNLGNAPAPDVPTCPDPAGTVTGVIEAGDVIGPGGDRGIQAGDFDTLLAAIEAGATYANVHTDAFPGGQIRGQIED